MSAGGGQAVNAFCRRNKSNAFQHLREKRQKQLPLNHDAVGIVSSEYRKPNSSPIQSRYAIHESSSITSTDNVTANGTTATIENSTGRPKYSQVSFRQIVSDDDLEDADFRNRLNDVKLIQKWRKKNRGLSAQKIFFPEEKEEKDEDDSLAFGLLDKQFTSKGDPANRDVDVHLEKFLKNHLDKNCGNIEECTKINDRTAELYKIPDHLVVKDTMSAYADKMNWVTGLVEVPLPLEVKLKNIEATERAKRTLLNLGKDRENKWDDPDYIVKRAFGSRFKTFEPIPKVKAPTDQIALANFRKRFRK